MIKMKKGAVVRKGKKIRGKSKKYGEKIWSLKNRDLMKNSVAREKSKKKGERERQARTKKREGENE